MRRSQLSAAGSDGSLRSQTRCSAKLRRETHQLAASTVDQKSVREVPPYDGWISSKSFFKTARIGLKISPFFKTISGRFEDIFKKYGLQNYSNRGTDPIIEDIFKNTYLQNYSNRGLRVTRTPQSMVNFLKGLVICSTCFPSLPLTSCHLSDLTCLLAFLTLYLHF